jgi:hypothetical protein
MMLFLIGKQGKASVRDLNAMERVRLLFMGASKPRGKAAMCETSISLRNCRVLHAGFASLARMTRNV